YFEDAFHLTWGSEIRELASVLNNSVSKEAVGLCSFVFLPGIVRNYSNWCPKDSTASCGAWIDSLPGACFSQSDGWLNRYRLLAQWDQLCDDSKKYIQGLLRTNAQLTSTALMFASLAEHLQAKIGQVTPAMDGPAGPR